MDSHLQSITQLPQKDKAQAYTALYSQLISNAGSPSLKPDLSALSEHLVTQDTVSLVTARQVISEYVTLLKNVSLEDTDLHKDLITDLLEILQRRSSSYEEQINALRFALADLLEDEEEWSEAARVLIAVPQDSAQRLLSDKDRLAILIRIVRLLLEDEDSVQAETYNSRAALLISTTEDRETRLQFKLCQARIMDYNRKFLEAASRYLELSWVGEIDEEERKQMLSAAVTCAVLAPAGPNRSRVLASIYRDERSASLPTYNILSKIFLDQILRSAEVQEFEATLKPHQLAKISLSTNDRLASIGNDDESDPSDSKRTSPSTVLDRAVMEHNLLASSKVYTNISFRGLGALLDLSPGAAETMARKMIEQGRLRGYIDQVERLIWFDRGGEEDNAQGKAGGLGDVEDAEDTGALYTKQWDMQIRHTAANVELLVQNLMTKGLVKP